MALLKREPGWAGAGPSSCVAPMVGEGGEQTTLGPDLLFLKLTLRYILLARKHHPDPQPSTNNPTSSFDDLVVLLYECETYTKLY